MLSVISRGLFSPFSAIVRSVNFRIPLVLNLRGAETSATESKSHSSAVDQATSGAAKDSPFATMFRNSKFMQLGDPIGKIVVARIVYSTDDDLYIDFGGKFWCVCKRPKKDGDLYRRNTLVVLRLHDFELSSRFLGASKDLTLLEADATLLGLARRSSGTSGRKRGSEKK